MKFIYEKMSKQVGIVRLDGRLDGVAPDQLKKVLADSLRENRLLVIDYSQLVFVDSRGLGALIASLRKALALEGDIRLADVQQKVKTFFELVRADRIFKIFSSVEEAAESFGADLAAGAMS